ncbi:MAG: hypothetical protein LBC26_01635 [Oscillospiraceae bacterium]|nr:hypothetical protein [Oscillospiraceae bacterium]
MERYAQLVDAIHSHGIMVNASKEKSQRGAFLLFNLLYRKYGAFTSLLARLIPMRTLGKWGAYLSYRPKTRPRLPHAACPSPRRGAAARPKRPFRSR